MRVSVRILLCCLCAALFLSAPALGETAGYTAGLEVPEGETLIQPAHPVPDYVVQLMDVARGELGYVEERSGVTKYGTWAGYPTAEWCAEFQCWCVGRTDRLCGTQLLNQVYPNYSGTNVGRDWFLAHGRYIARAGVVPGWGSQWFKGEENVMAKNSYIPQPGDWMFLTNNSAGDTCHVAMVEFCAQAEDGSVRVHVIEGNNVTKPAPQGVERNVYDLSYWQILGYGTVHDLADITLRFGNGGPKVVALQRELVQAGLLEERYITGKYGAITTDAIQTIQKQNGIPVTGIANLETRLALQRMIRSAAGQ